MSLALSHHGGWMRWPTIRSTASKAATASARVSQRRVAMASSKANAAFRQSSQRKGSWTKRNLGRYCQSGLLTENISSVVTLPQTERGSQNVSFFKREAWERQIANTIIPISARATYDTSKLKRL